MRLLSRMAVLVLVLAFAPLTVMAEDKGDDYKYNYLAGWVGVNFGGDFFAAGPFQSFDAGNPMAFGASLGFWQKGLIGGEVDFGYNRNFFGNPDDIGSANNLITFTGNLTINPTFKMGSQSIRPYLLVGGGLARSRIEDFDILGGDTKNKGVLDFGGGIIYYFLPRVGIRGDIRYFKGVGGNGSGDGWGWIEDWNWWRATVGVAFSF